MHAGEDDSLVRFHWVHPSACFMRLCLPVFAVAAALLACTLSLRAEVLLVPRGSVWKYYYNGPVATNWMKAGFDDHTWSSGPGQLGYGDGDEQTVLIDDPGFEPPGTYFRHVFTNSTLASTLTLRLLVDDGAVVYINGAEVLRQNMPGGAVVFQTLAVVNIETNESRFTQWGIFPGSLRQGTNIIAVEVHQHAAGGYDNSFDLELVANIPASAPVVQITSPSDGTITQVQQLRIETFTSDAAAHIREVSFYTNGAFLGSSTAEPFSYTWTNPPTGRYAMRARAIDYFSVVAISEAIFVQIGDGTEQIKITRGPYLQSGTPSSMVVRWRTDWRTNSVLRFGASVGSLDQALTNLQSTYEHQMLITGLQPDTTYFYSVGSTNATFASGPEFYFHTSPSNAAPVRLWVIGDSGTSDVNAKAVRDAYYQNSVGQHTDVWLMLGDNAYGEDGSDDEYQRAVFDMYPELLRQTVLWPAIGNHDAGDNSEGSVAPYLTIFTLPAQGDAGGVPSGKEQYYSFDYANIHFVCLDSYTSDRSTNGPMLTWLKSDLAATDRDWIIAYWHHPPYSWGSHNSDGDSYETEMREWVLPILESYGVDLVLSGHSHNYERSFLIDGHYGYSWDFEPEMLLDGGLGRSDSDHAYEKPAGGMGARKGAVYTVCGCSGAGGEASIPLHPAMAVAHGGFGSMIIDINGLQLNGRFLRPTMEIDDYFTIDKSIPIVVGPQLQIASQTNSTILSWPTALPQFGLQWASHLPAAQWHPVTDLPITLGRRKVVSLPAYETNRFFRLRSQPSQ
jgi:hypothetical protein